jgi:hypothetical protein
MATQTATTNAVAAALAGAGWQIVFVCVPNTVHHGVVPISTPDGAARQRYPDVLAVDGDTTRLVEIENALTEAVAEDIALRLTEQATALEDPAYWETWRRHVEAEHEIQMPPTFAPSLELVIGGGQRRLDEALVARLAAAGIWVGRLAEFEARLAG